MLEFLRSVALTVSGIVVFGSLCEMILPNGTYKKYIHLSLGLVLVIALISPIINFDKDSIDFTDSNIAYIDTQTMEESQRDDVIRLYKKNLALNMKKEIEDIAGVNFDIKCDVYEDEENFGKIKNISVIVDAESGVKISDAAIEQLKENYSQNITVKYIG